MSTSTSDISPASRRLSLISCIARRNSQHAYIQTPKTVPSTSSHVEDQLHNANRKSVLSAAYSSSSLVSCHLPGFPPAQLHSLLRDSSVRVCIRLTHVRFSARPTLVIAIATTLHYPVSIPLSYPKRDPGTFSVPSFRSAIPGCSNPLRIST